MTSLLKHLLTVVLILSYNSANCMEDPIPNPSNSNNQSNNSNTKQLSSDIELRLKPLLTGASVEALTIDEYKKCMDFLSKYNPLLKQTVDDFFNAIYNLAIYIFEDSYFLEPDQLDTHSVNVNNTLLIQKIALWAANNKLYEEESSAKKSSENFYRLYYNLDTHQMDHTLYENVDYHYLKPNPIQIHSSLIFFKEINYLFNSAHKKLNPNYKPIEITDYLKTHQEISAKGFWRYLANNFIQFVNEICNKINLKCDEYTNTPDKESLYETIFNTKYIKELTNYIYNDCIIPCYNTIWSIFNDYFSTNNLNSTDMLSIGNRNSDISMHNIMSIQGSYQIINAAQKKYILSQKRKYISSNSVLCCDLVSRYCALGETLFNSISTFCEQFCSLNIPHNTKKDLSNLMFSVRDKVFSYIKKRYEKLTNLETIEDINQCIKSYYEDIAELRQYILNALIHIHDCQNGPMVYNPEKNTCVLEPTRVFDKKYDIEFKDSQQSKMLFHSGMNKIIDDIKNMQLKPLLTAQAYLNDINTILKKYRD